MNHTEFATFLCGHFESKITSSDFRATLGSVFIIAVAVCSQVIRHFVSAVAKGPLSL